MPRTGVWALQGKTGIHVCYIKATADVGTDHWSLAQHIRGAPVCQARWTWEGTWLCSNATFSTLDIQMKAHLAETLSCFIILTSGQSTNAPLFLQWWGSRNQHSSQTCQWLVRTEIYQVRPFITLSYHGVFRDVPLAAVPSLLPSCPHSWLSHPQRHHPNLLTSVAAAAASAH